MCLIDFLNTNSGAVQSLATIVLVIVTFVYVLLTRKLANESKRMADLTDKSHLQPVIVFNRSGQRPWKLKNVGNGPALNVLVSGGTKEKVWNETNTILLSAVGSNEEVALEWLTKKDTGALCAIYKDVAEREYTSECVGNRNSVDDGNKYQTLTQKYFQWQIPNLLKEICK